MLTKQQKKELLIERQELFDAIHHIESILFRYNERIITAKRGEYLDPLHDKKDKLQEQVLANEIRIDEINKYIRRER